MLAVSQWPWWGQVPAGEYRRAQGEVQLQRAAGGEAKPWQCTATKQVEESKTTTGASLIKNTGALCWIAL